MTRKLTYTQVSQIRLLWPLYRRHGATQQQLADMFGVTQPTVHQVATGKTWRS